MYYLKHAEMVLIVHDVYPRKRNITDITKKWNANTLAPHQSSTSKSIGVSPFEQQQYKGQAPLPSPRKFAKAKPQHLAAQFCKG